MLVAPSEAYRRSYVEAELEFAADDGSHEPITDATFAAALERWAQYRAGSNLPAGHVASTELWLVDGDGYIGRASIRHELTERLRTIGGHIGYAIRPSRRRRGHGTRVLQLALPYANALGIDPALVTCDHDNVASRKIIEAAGGVLDTSVDGSEKLRYWVATA